jgi:hypothetical protein
VAAEIVRGAVIAVEIVVAVGVLVAAVDVVAVAVGVLVVAVVVDATAAMEAVAEGDTKLLPRICTDSTDKPKGSN